MLCNMMVKESLPRRAGSRNDAPRWRAVALAGLLAAGASSCSDRGTMLTDPDTGTTPGDTYTAALLAAPGASRSNGWALNDAGVAAGWSDVAGGRAVRWQHGAAATDFLGADSGTRGINNAGAIVGWVRHPDGIQRGFVHVDGIRIDLEHLYDRGHASAINDAGTVVGVGPTEAGTRAMVWRRGPDGSYGQPEALAFGSPTEGPHINARGDIVFSANIWGLHRPLIWPDGSNGGYGEPIWLGRPVDVGYYAKSMNDQGVVVGFRQSPWTDERPVAVVWLPGDYDNPIDLGIGEAWSINEKNQIVGTTGGNLPVFGGAARRPALWTIEADGSITGPRDIGSPTGYQSGAARAINDEGVIIGSSWGPGEVAATLWRPGS
jgi:probable HAF family extracellular repeat protein